MAHDVYAKTAKIADSFGNADGAAIFGYFTYRSNALNKTVTSPLSILARSKDGKLSFVQFMEDTLPPCGASKKRYLPYQSRTQWLGTRRVSS